MLLELRGQSFAVVSFEFERQLYFMFALSDKMDKV